MLSDDLQSLKGMLDDRSRRLNGHLYFDLIEAAQLVLQIADMIDKASQLEGATIPLGMRDLPDGVVNFAAYRRPTGGGAA